MNDTQQHERAGELIRRCSEAETGGDIPALQSAAQEALQLAQLKDDLSLAAAGNYYLGRASLRQGSLPEARQHFEKAQALSRTANARKVEADTLRSLGIVYLYQGEQSLSMAAFEQAVGLHRAIDDHKGECFALNNMGSLAIRQGDLDHARAWYEESLQAAEASGDPDAKLVVLMSLGDLEETYLGDLTKARQYYQEILRLARLQQNDLNIAIACSGIGSTSLFLGDLAAAEPALLEAARLRTYPKIALSKRSAQAILMKAIQFSTFLHQRVAILRRLANHPNVLSTTQRRAGKVISPGIGHSSCLGSFLLRRCLICEV